MTTTSAKVTTTMPTMPATTPTLTVTLTVVAPRGIAPVRAKVGR
jgi:hypothetical protein